LIGRKERKDPNQMSFLEHLGELRHRILASLVAVFVAFAGCYVVSDTLLDILARPLRDLLPEGAAIIGTGVYEAFLVKILVALVGGVVLACPFWLYEMWMFVAPGLYPHERKLVVPFVFFASVFFVGGVVFGYLVVFPVGFEFFLDQYTKAAISAQIRIREYFSFTTKLLLAFGLSFELPVVSFFLGRLGIVSWRTMLRTGKYAVLVIFIAAAVLTPPDVASQVLLAGPLLLLYGLSIVLVALTGKSRRKRRAGDEDEGKDGSRE